MSEAQHNTAQRSAALGTPAPVVLSRHRVPLEMAAPSCKAVYKKKDGIVTLTDDQASVTWTPLPGTGTPTVSLSILNITSEPLEPSYLSLNRDVLTWTPKISRRLRTVQLR